MYTVHTARSFIGSPAKPVATFATFAEAEKFVRAQYKPVVFEVDTDHPTCADFISGDLTVGCIEGPR